MATSSAEPPKTTEFGKSCAVRGIKLNGLERFLEPATTLGGPCPASGTWVSKLVGTTDPGSPGKPSRPSKSAAIAGGEPTLPAADGRGEPPSSTSAPKPCAVPCSLSPVPCFFARNDPVNALTIVGSVRSSVSRPAAATAPAPIGRMYVRQRSLGPMSWIGTVPGYSGPGRCDPKK